MKLASARRATDDAHKPRDTEFLLAAACCVWPPTDDRNEAIRRAARNVSNWRRFLNVARRQRVIGLVQHALNGAGVRVPADVAHELAAESQAIAVQNLFSAREAAHLYRAFAARNIPAIFVKGVALAQLAYGSLALKHSKDIDVLVPPDRAEAALRLLEQEGYGLWRPRERLSMAQRRVYFRHGIEAALVQKAKSIEVELHWRLVRNPLLLKTIGEHPLSQDVVLFDDVSVPTLRTYDLFAYLCVHGAQHGWSRLKWLVDVRALLSQASDAEIECLYRHAAAIGAGTCVAQALLLCRMLLGLVLSPEMQISLEKNIKTKILVRVALYIMMSSVETDYEHRFGVRARYIVSYILMADGIGGFLSQLKNFLISPADAIAFPMPDKLHFLYLVLRIPSWVLRRAFASIRYGSTRPG